MSISVQEISIIIAAKDLSPSILSPDFLKYSDIAPSDWQYDQQPVIANNGVRISYDNGVRITSQPNRVAFAQLAPTQDQPQFLINSMAAKFVEKLPNADYVAVGVNPRGLVPFFENNRGAHDFLFRQLFAQGSWQDFGQAPAQAAIQLSYVLEQGQLNLSINEAKLKGQDGKAVSAVVFSGNFNYPVRGDMGLKRVQNVIERIQLWQSTVATFQQLVNERFLGAPHSPLSQPGVDIPIAPPATENEMVL